MNGEELIELSDKIRLLKEKVALTRSERITAELEAWEQVDFDAEGIKLAKQKETRVLKEIEKEIGSQRAAEALFEHSERVFKIYFTDYTKEV